MAPPDGHWGTAVECDPLAWYVGEAALRRVEHEAELLVFRVRHSPPVRPVVQVAEGLLITPPATERLDA
ncbi:MAG: hypothetical protein OEV61_09090 [Chloroflexota bacterium]|nr:hypothetical protein [Chloroflexota bacterium]